MNDARSSVIERVRTARELIPRERRPPLAPDPALGGAPGWHPFEHTLWNVGEDIRRLLLKKPRLREDAGLQDEFLRIALDRRALRGRQSFVMLLGHKCCAAHASALAAQLDDPAVDGQIIWALYRMKARGFQEQVQPLVGHEKTWIRREAKRYLAWERAAR